MTDLDARTALLTFLAPHVTGAPKLLDIAKYLASDQGAAFYQAPFNNRKSSRFNGTGGLVQATLHGYSALRILDKTAQTLFTPSVTDRTVMIYALLMISRWADLREGRMVFDDAEPARGSIATLGMVNALVFGVTDLTAGEVQALTSWARSRAEMAAAHEPFNPQWWVLNQTMDFVFLAGGTP